MRAADRRSDDVLPEKVERMTPGGGRDRRHGGQCKEQHGAPGDRGGDCRQKAQPRRETKGQVKTRQLGIVQPVKPLAHQASAAEARHRDIVFFNGIIVK